MITIGGDLVSFGIYWKQLAVFALLASLAGGGLWFVKSQQSSEASPKRAAIPNTQLATLAIALQDGGSATVNGTVFPGLVRFANDRQVFAYQAYQGDGSFVDQLTTTVTLPSSVDPATLIARHTASYGSLTQEPIVTNRGATYVVSNLTPSATYRIELVMPSGTVKPSLLGRLIDSVRNLQPGWWLAVALGLPLIAVGVLSVMFGAALRSWRGPVVRDMSETPPQDLSPAVAALLVKGKVSPRVLAATLLHLAQRGFVQVVHRPDGFSFGKRRQIDLAVSPSNTAQQPATALTPYEQILLEKIFTGTAMKSSGEDIQLRLGRHIFSRKIAQVYLHMYDQAVAQGWFVQNPQAIYRWYRSLSLLVIAAAVVGFLVSLLFGPEPYFYLLGWAGLFFVGLVMHKITPFLPRRTKLGDAQYQQWVKFQNYLASSRPIGNVAQAQRLYEQYLPYAVAFGVEVEWTERFLRTPFHVPDWYSSVEEIHVIEDFANNLFPIVGSVASDLAKAREPSAV